jgi:hypothetical protein
MTKDKGTEDEFNRFLQVHDRKVLGADQPCEEDDLGRLLAEAREAMIARQPELFGPKPFYGVDGNLLIEDLPAYLHEGIEAKLNGTWKPPRPIDGMAIGQMLQEYPRLRGEMEKRRHRRAYRAKLEAKRSALPAQGVKREYDTG